MTKAKQLKKGWKQCPSVTTGGKAHFWTRPSTSGGYYKIVWNRLAQKWTLDSPGDIGLGMFKTDTDAMRLFDTTTQLVQSYKKTPEVLE